jgi:hypothetical protein
MSYTYEEVQDIWCKVYRIKCGRTRVKILAVGKKLDSGWEGSNFLDKSYLIGRILYLNEIRSYTAVAICNGQYHFPFWCLEVTK